MFRSFWFWKSQTSVKSQHFLRILHHVVDIILPLRHLHFWNLQHEIPNSHNINWNDGNNSQSFCCPFQHENLQTTETNNPEWRRTLRVRNGNRAALSKSYATNFGHDAGHRRAGCVSLCLFHDCTVSVALHKVRLYCLRKCWIATEFWFTAGHTRRWIFATTSSISCWWERSTQVKDSDTLILIAH